MAVQLPSEVLGTAVGVLIWSFLCLACSGLMAWLTWDHREKTSYIALFAYFPGLATCASIAQQLHTIVRWRDIKIAQHYYSIANIGKPELAVAGPSMGVDLVLFYIQFYCYNVMSLLVLTWAASLAQSIFKARRLQLIEPVVTNIAKITSILLPVLFLSLLRIETIQNSTVAFLVIANILMAIGMIGAMILLLAIIGKYVHTRVNVASWNFPYGTGSATRLTENSGYQMPAPRRNIYDRWLLLRFTIALLAMTAFQMFIIYFEVTSAQENKKAELEDSPDLSPEKARSDFLLFISGVSPGLIAFLVFGTTKVLRAYMWEKLVPRCLKRRLRKRKSVDIEMTPR